MAWSEDARRGSPASGRTQQTIGDALLAANVQVLATWAENSFRIGVFTPLTKRQFGCNIISLRRCQSLRRKKSLEESSDLSRLFDLTPYFAHLPAPRASQRSFGMPIRHRQPPLPWQLKTRFIAPTHKGWTLLPNWHRHCFPICVDRAGAPGFPVGYFCFGGIACVSRAAVTTA